MKWKPSQISKMISKVFVLYIWYYVARSSKDDWYIKDFKSVILNIVKDVSEVSSWVQWRISWSYQDAELAKHELLFLILYRNPKYSKESFRVVILNKVKDLLIIPRCFAGSAWPSSLEQILSSWIKWRIFEI